MTTKIKLFLTTENILVQVSEEEEKGHRKEIEGAKEKKAKQRDRHHQMRSRGKIKGLVGKSLVFFSFFKEFNIECLVGTSERQVAVNWYTAGNSCVINSDGWLALWNGPCFFCCYTGSSFRTMVSTERFEDPDYRGDSSSRPSMSFQVLYHRGNGEGRGLPN